MNPVKPIFSLNSLGVLILAALAGVFIVEYFVSQPAWMYVHLAIALACMVAASVWIARGFASKTGMILAVLALAAFLGGYLARNAAFLAQEEARELPAITRAEGDPGDGHTAILYYTHGEPPTYSPMPWVETIREFDSDKVPFVPFFARPLFFNVVRSEYLRMGESPHNAIHQQIVESLQPVVSPDGTMPIYLAFLDSNPRPDEMMIRALNDGASKVIVMPVFITVSSHTIAGQEMVESVLPEKFGATVCYADPLWNSATFQQSFVERTNAARGETDKSGVGVLLIGHGQPREWDAIYPTQTEQETLYREAIKALLVRDGYSADNIILSWMEFQDPQVVEGLHTLAANGVEKILVFSTSISARSIHSDIEVPDAIKEAALPASITVTDLGAWGDPQNALMMQALAQNIGACQPKTSLE